jgi:hypothetical protein
MNVTYRCPDGRETLLDFNEDTLRVDATSRAGEAIGRFQFELVGPDGEGIDLMDDSGEGGEAVSLRLAEHDLRDDWHGQGITAHVMDVMASETGLSLTPGLVKEA